MKLTKRQINLVIKLLSAARDASCGYQGEELATGETSQGQQVDQAYHDQAWQVLAQHGFRTIPRPQEILAYVRRK